jgi:HAAS
MAHPRPGNRIADHRVGRIAGRLAGRTAADATAASHSGPALEPRETPEPAGPQRLDAEIEGYLAAIATRLASLGLAGPRRARQTIIAELRDGLLEATTANLEQGLRPEQAAQAAVEEFGDPTTVAAAFAPELAGIHARRTALTLTRTGPLVGLLWIAALTATHAPPTRHELTGAWLAFPLVGLGLATAALGTILAVATTGWPSRWLTPSPRRAPTAAAIVAIAAIVVDLTLLGMLAGQAIIAPATLTTLSGFGSHGAAAVVLLAPVASITRLALSGRATRRTLAARASLA